MFKCVYETHRWQGTTPGGLLSVRPKFVNHKFVDLKFSVDPEVKKVHQSEKGPPCRVRSIFPHPIGFRPQASTHRPLPTQVRSSQVRSNQAEGVLRPRGSQVEGVSRPKEAQIEGGSTTVCSAAHVGENTDSESADFPA